MYGHVRGIRMPSWIVTLVCVLLFFNNAGITRKGFVCFLRNGITRLPGFVLFKLLPTCMLRVVYASPPSNLAVVLSSLSLYTY